MSVTLKCRALAIMMLAVVSNPSVAEQNSEIQYSDSSIGVTLPQTDPFFFWERFDFAFNPRSDRVFADQFHPLRILRRTSHMSSFEEQQAYGARVAQRAISRSVIESLRESAVDTPLMSWLHDRQEFVADLLRFSIGSVAEESVSPLEIHYDAEERSWWRDLRESGKMRYGIRPFRTSPYAYWGLALKDGRETVLLANARYYYDHFKEHRFELAVSMPLPHGFGIDLGTSYQIGGNDDPRRLVFKLFRELKAGGIMHVGFEWRDSPMLFAGTSFSW